MKKRKRRFRINEDTMTTIVVSSLLLCVVILSTGFVFVWFDKDPNALVDYGLRVFGTELGICGFITICKRILDAKDRQIEESRRRAEERRKERMNRNGQNDI
ncbi:MAG: hypothetical protein IKY38_01380, partial [Anaerotignum sp.]|nr:hypothetical protein [Anaerotignum sp.]